MKKTIFSGLLLAATMPVMAESIEEMSDTSRVQDLDEVVVVSQPKEQVRLHLQPVSSSVFTSAATGQKLYFGQLGNPRQFGVDLRLHF